MPVFTKKIMSEKKQGQKKQTSKGIKKGKQQRSLPLKKTVKKQMKKNRKVSVKSLLAVLIAVLGLLLTYGFYKYQDIFKSNVSIKNSESAFFYIPTGSTYQDVIHDMDSANFLINMESFKWLAKKKNYPMNIKPGRYQIKTGMSNNALVNMLRSGRQAPVRITFNSFRTDRQLAGFFGKMLEADSLEIMQLFNDETFIGELGFNKHTIRVMFIPNTYEIYWNTSAEELFKRFNKEYENFWNKTRTHKLERLSLTKEKAIILASIVEQETNKYDEMPAVAGVYLNRIKRGIPLQADPTVIYAIGDFSIRRVLNRHTRYASPYNTYLNKGLPPGPICFPSHKTIDMVLDFEEHDYYYFCAKEDFSGYHRFAKTLQQHMQNARKYQNALNRRNIR